MNCFLNLRRSLGTSSGMCVRGQGCGRGSGFWMLTLGWVWGRGSGWRGLQVGSRPLRVTVRRKLLPKGRQHWGLRWRVHVSRWQEVSRRRQRGRLRDSGVRRGDMGLGGVYATEHGLGEGQHEGDMHAAVGLWLCPHAFRGDVALVWAPFKQCRRLGLALQDVSKLIGGSCCRECHSCRQIAVPRRGRLAPIAMPQHFVVKWQIVAQLCHSAALTCKAVSDSAGFCIDSACERPTQASEFGCRICIFTLYPTAHPRPSASRRCELSFHTSMLQCGSKFFLLVSPACG